MRISLFETGISEQGMHSSLIGAAGIALTASAIGNLIFSTRTLAFMPHASGFSLIMIIAMITSLVLLVFFLGACSTMPWHGASISVLGGVLFATSRGLNYENWRLASVTIALATFLLVVRLYSAWLVRNFPDAHV